MKKLSFCVPVYNREEKIEKCLLSLINQTEPEENYEIIVVDDCSTDGTFEKVQSIFEEEGFKNYKLYKLDENSGNASIPRNTAAEHAEGEYLFFVDSDDFVAKELVTHLYDFAKINNSDIIYPKYAKGNEDDIKGNVPRSFAKHGSIGNADIIENNMLNALSVLKAFKKSEWDRLNLKFDKDVLIGEDMLVTARFLFNTKVHSVLADQPYYFIVHHADERLTSSKQSKNRTFENYKEILNIIYEGELGDQNFKDRAAAAFVDRIMNFGIGNTLNYLIHIHKTKVHNDWLELFADLFNSSFPERAEEYVNERFYNRLRAYRQKDGNAVLLAYQSELQQLKIDELERKINALTKKDNSFINRNKKRVKRKLKTVAKTAYNKLK